MKISLLVGNDSLPQQPPFSTKPMDSRYPISRAQAFVGMTSLPRQPPRFAGPASLALISSFPRKRESIGVSVAGEG